MSWFEEYSELGDCRVHVGGQDSLLISQTEDGGSEPEFANLPPDELSVFRMDDAQSHQTVLIHPHQASSSHLRSIISSPNKLYSRVLPLAPEMTQHRDDSSLHSVSSTISAHPPPTIAGQTWVSGCWQAWQLGGHLACSTLGDSHPSLSSCDLKTGKHQPSANKENLLLKSLNPLSVSLLESLSFNERS